MSKRKYLTKEERNFEIGERIYEVRVRKGLSQAQLAKKIKTKQSGIARVENGKSVSNDLIARISQALDIDWLEFFPSNKKIETKQHTKIEFNIHNLTTADIKYGSIETLNNIKYLPSADKMQKYDEYFKGGMMHD